MKAFIHAFERTYKQASTTADTHIYTKHKNNHARIHACMYTNTRFFWSCYLGLYKTKFCKKYFTARREPL